MANHHHHFGELPPPINPPTYCLLLSELVATLETMLRMPGVHPFIRAQIHQRWTQLMDIHPGDIDIKKITADIPDVIITRQTTTTPGGRTVPVIQTVLPGDKGI